ncbi:hypothetical protein EMIT0111MI5_90032 [Burkholderia sp. IT-111MI5]
MRFFNNHIQQWEYSTHSSNSLD